MKKIVLLAAMALLGAGFSTSAIAQTKTAPQSKGLPSTNVTKEQIDAARMMYDNMTPQQKSMLAEEVKKRAETITPQQKEAIIERAKTHYNSLSPQEKAALTTRLLELGSRLTPEQRAEFLGRMN